VLEVGAIPSNSSLLCMKSLKNATEKIGINLNGPYEYQDFRIVQGNANCMECFADNQFDTVLCNATLEHDKYFWKTIAEIKRVTKPNGLIAIGTPGYDWLPLERLKRPLRVLLRIPSVRKFSDDHLLWLLRSTLTINLHNAPGDYYRFSPQAFKEVFFEGLRDVEVYPVLLPPTIMGSGIKP
jgi:SAM-dependent methyltransferase